jgi:L-rhamnose mutarotase
MKRASFMIKVRQDKIEEYKARHRAVWPDMLTALRESGWHNYSIFMREDGLLFGYLETENGLEAARARMRQTDVYARWQASMAPLMEELGAPYSSLRSVELEEVFHLD